jgi:hypothetical protein
VNPTLLTDIDFGRQQKDSLIRRVSAPKFDIPVKFRRKRLQKTWGFSRKVKDIALDWLASRPSQKILMFPFWP